MTALEAQHLFLLFHIGVDRYAIDTGEIAEVLAVRALKAVPATPPWVVGLLAYRGRSVPVIDLSARSNGSPAPRKTSTRLVLVHYRRTRGNPMDGLLGLILEQATDTLRCRPADFRDYGLDNQGSPYLGPVLEHPQGLVQRVTVERLLPDDVHAMLFPAAGLA
jgi:chemotaxis-related protein WspB